MVSATMSKALITKLIIFYSAIYGLDSNVALSVAKIESGLNPNAVGQLHELGVFQLRPEHFPKYTKAQLKDPIIGIQLGIQHLIELKHKSKLKKSNQWIIAHNLGLSGSKKIKHPELYPYYKRFNIAMQSL